MGDLVKLIPHSEVTATLEILDRLGVRREHLSKFRGASSWLQQQIAGALIAGNESFFSITPVPEDNMEFELMLNPAEADPIEMVRADGYDNPEKWKFAGDKIKQPVTRTFTHLDLGSCRNLDEARGKADKLGYKLADGRFRAAYRQKFPKPTRPIAVVFGGGDWRGPSGSRHVPYLDGGGGAWYSHFYWSGRDFYGGCRWVASKK